MEDEELNASHQVYATTNYSYDDLGNLTQVEDDSNNTTTMTYDWLSRKTAMTDPDMGSWSYVYDSNGNLTSQTDAKTQTITFSYDALNRLIGKTYPPGLGMTDVSYSYDSTEGGNYGKGQRTSMTDALGTTAYKYDNRGLLIEEKRTVDSVDYTTQFDYDGADRMVSITYPTGEEVTQEYNGRGLSYSLAGSIAGNLITSTFYNSLGSISEINLGNSTRTTFGYWDVGGSYDTSGGYYGRLWRIKTSKQPGDDPLLQDVKHTWDAIGNLTQREDVLSVETESFTYDFLDRLTAVSGPYTESYAYNKIGNITSKNGTAYTYGSKPHAVTAVGTTSYSYDNNGNMTTRGSQTITYDVENRPVSTIDGGNTSTFVYDGDGNRVKKTESGETILYINQYYEKNLTTGEVTTYYYLGDRLIAMRADTDLSYIHQDHLTGTAVVSDSSGASAGTMKYYPFGTTRSTSGTVPTDKRFTGQRLDSTGLYYYGARYYDANIGRFISADSIVPNPVNPQSLNRYSYAINNPLKYTDPMGNSFQLPQPFFTIYNPFNGICEPYEIKIPPNWNKLLIAYIYAVHQFPEISHYGCDPLTDITWGLSGMGSVTFGDERIGGQGILVDSSLRDASVLEVALILAHELVGHVAEGRFSNSVFEETRGFQVVDRARICWNHPNADSTFEAQFRDIDLSFTGDALKKQLLVARTSYLREVGEPSRTMYTNLPLEPPTWFSEYFWVRYMIYSWEIGFIKYTLGK